jgi:hypothetical protein
VAAQVRESPPAAAEDAAAAAAPEEGAQAAESVHPFIEMSSPFMAVGRAHQAWTDIGASPWLVRKLR